MTWVLVAVFFIAYPLTVYGIAFVALWWAFDDSQKAWRVLGGNYET